MTKAFKDHFSAKAEIYAASRPTYPPELAALLAETAPAQDLALDCGCGNGQLSALLANHFARVVATDASGEQIKNIKPHPAIDFRVAPAEASGLPDGVANLITAAQAAHWFDLEGFYAEIRRVARPGALLALICYAVGLCEGEAGKLIHDFHWHGIGPYWPPERRHVEAAYQTFSFPFPELDMPKMNIERQWTRQQYLNYADTWSAVRAVEKAGKRKIFDDFSEALAKVWPADETMTIRWPITIRAGWVNQSA